MEIKHLYDAVICQEDDTVLEVSRILRDTQQRHLFVVNAAQEPTGVISTVDINNRVVSEEKNPKTVVASDIMTKDIATVELAESYQKAYEVMVEKGLYSLPITQDKKLIGLLDFNRLFTQVRECVRDAA